MRAHRASFAVLTTLAFLAACSPDFTGPVASPPADLSLAAAVSGTPTGRIASQINNGMCLDVWGGGSAAGTPVKLYGCHGGGNQKWTATAAGEFRNNGSTMCLDANSGLGREGDNLILWPCNGGANQKWQYTATGEVKGINGLCISVWDGSAVSGARVAIRSCSSQASQKWNAPSVASTPVPPPDTTPTTPPPSGPTTLVPGDNWQAKVSAQPTGTVFRVAAGVHRLQSVRPKAGQQFLGDPGAVMSGARLLTDFTREGAYWVAAGQTQQGEAAGACSAGRDGCQFPEELFRDDVRLRRVTSLGAVAPGAWYFDYAADKIYFADDPTGRRVEVSVAPYAFIADAGDGVTVRGLTIEKYAVPAQRGAVWAVSSTGWVVLNNVIRWNHGAGVRLGSGWRVAHNQLLSNGQLGAGIGLSSGTAVGAALDSNEIAYNNAAGFDPYWEAGGAKLLRTTGLRVRGNYVHHNTGYAVWTDHNNDAALIEGNRVTDNTMAGIYHEISASAVIRNNTVERNGTATSAPTGAGIVVDNSHNVEVVGNTVADNRGGGIMLRQVVRSDLPASGGPYGPYELHDVFVHDNAVIMTVGQTGLVQYVGDPTYWTGRNNRFANNQYRLGTLSAYFQWQNAARTEAQWQAAGQDLTGTFSR